LGCEKKRKEKMVGEVTADGGGIAKKEERRFRGLWC